LKAINVLAINNNQKVLEKQMTELKEKSNDNEYIIKGKLQEKDEQINQLIKKQEKFEQLIHSLIESGQLKAKVI
jgi:hypothetical protein